VPGLGKGKALEAGSSSEERRRLIAKGTSSSSAYMLSMMIQGVAVQQVACAKNAVLHNRHMRCSLEHVVGLWQKCNMPYVTVVFRILQSSCTISAHVTKHISTQSTVTAHIRLCSQMSAVADLDGCLM